MHYQPCPRNDGVGTAQWIPGSPPTPPSASSLLAMAHLSICDTRHGFVAGWLDGWMAGSKRCLGGGGQVDNGEIHVRYGMARHTVRRDYLTSMRCDAMRMDCLPALPILLGREEGDPQKMPCVPRTFLCTAPAAIVRPSPASKHVPSGLQTDRASSPEQASNWLTTQVVSWLWAGRPSCPIGRGVDHLMCPAAQVTAIGWKSQRGYRTSGG